jgi:hypothetical protein
MHDAQQDPVPYYVSDGSWALGEGQLWSLRPSMHTPGSVISQQPLPLFAWLTESPWGSTKQLQQGGGW